MPANGKPSEAALALRPRSVLVIIPSLRGGGAERVIVTLLRHLDRSRFHLAIAVLDSRDAVFRSELPDDVEFIDLESWRVRRSVLRIIRLIWQRRPDVVLSVIGHLNLAIGLLSPLLPRHVRLIAREAAPVREALRGLFGTRFWEMVVRRVYPNFHVIVCQSHAMRQELVAKFGVPSERTVVIHNPVDIQRVERLAAEPLPPNLDDVADRGFPGFELVAAGRLSAEKGFDLLIEALALLGDSRYRVTILGEGPLRADLEELAARLGVSARVRLVGWQRNPYAFFARSNVFVLSSRYEGFPNVVLEALACGVPVIATPAPGGVFEILRDRPLCVISSEISAAGLAKAIADHHCRQRPAGLMRSPTEYSAGNIAAQYGTLFMPQVANV